MVWSIAFPQRMHAEPALAYNLLVFLISSWEVHVSSSISPSVYALTCALNASKPTVHASTNSRSYNSSSMITLIIPNARSRSLPGLICRCISDLEARLLWRGSINTYLDPLRTVRPTSGARTPSALVARWLAPHTRISSGGCSRSG